MRKEWIETILKISQVFLSVGLIVMSLSYAEETKVIQKIEGYYDHNISLKRMIVDITSNISEQNINIYQNGKKIENISWYQMSKIYQGDLNGDGFDELVLQTFSGGVHCCFNMLIIQLKPSMSKSYSCNLANTEFVEFKDLDGDNKPEIITWDDSYSYFASLCFACSPSVRIVVNFNGEELALRPKLIEKHYRLKTKVVKRIDVNIDEQGTLKLNSEYAADIVGLILHNFYTAQPKEAVDVMRAYLNFAHPAVRKLFLLQLTDAMSQSPFHDQLRKLNNWYHHVPCNSKGCEPSIELYKKYEIVWKLFEMYDCV